MARSLSGASGLSTRVCRAAGTSIGFAWYNSFLTAYVDGSLIGSIPNTDWVNGNFLNLVGGTLSGMLYTNSGINFNNAVSTNGPQDMSRGITLWGTPTRGYGFVVTSNTLNYNVVGANTQHCFYADNTLLFSIISGTYVLSALPIYAQSWLLVSGDLQVNGRQTIHGASGAWGAFNFGQQLLINSGGANNTAIGIADSSGTKWAAIVNSGGTLLFSGMPAIDRTASTPPTNWLQLGATATAFIELEVPGSGDVLRT